jgi:hypothetical protein
MGVPIFGSLGIGAHYWRVRQECLADPVLKRALQELNKDQRVADYCGENIKPGWIITRHKHAAENWVKYDMKIGGAAGKL